MQAREAKMQAMEAKTQAREMRSWAGEQSMLPQMQRQRPCDEWSAPAHQHCQRPVWPKEKSSKQDEWAWCAGRCVSEREKRVIYTVKT